MGMFRRRKDRAQQSAAIYGELNDKLERLEKAVQTAGQRPAEYHISIERLHIDKPVLEQLLFRLDSLDVEEISGSLNLGNNFGTASAAKKPEKPEKSPSPRERQGSEGGPGEMDKTASGYRFKLPR